MSLIEERLRFQQLEPTGRLNGVQQQPLPPRPNERAPSYRSPRSTPMRGEKGYQQWQDYKKQQIRPTYLGNNDPYAQLTATMTDQPTNRLPYAPRRPQTLNFTPRPPQNNPVRQPNPLFCSPHQAAMAAQGRASKSVAPRLSFNPITQDPSSMCPPGVVPDARILKLVAGLPADHSHPSCLFFSLLHCHLCHNTTTIARGITSCLWQHRSVLRIIAPQDLLHYFGRKVHR